MDKNKELTNRKSELRHKLTFLMLFPSDSNIITIA